MKNIQPDFRRALILVACIHGVLILGIIYFMRQPVKRPQEQVTWLDTGSFGSGASTSALPADPIQGSPAVVKEKKTEPKEAEEETKEEKEEPLSTPPPSESPIVSQATPEEESTPPLSESKSEIPLAAPTPILTPTPKPTPKPTPRPASKPTVKPSPKPTPKPTPPLKSKEETKPVPKSSPQVTPKPTPKVPAKNASQEKAPARNSPVKKESSSHEKSEAKSKSVESIAHGDPSAKAAFLKSKNGSGNSSSSSYGEGSGTGVNSGALGAYHELIHDRFYSQWEQPTTIPTEHKHDFVCTLQLTIEPDGTISHFALSKPSGNPVMDASVLAAAGKVPKIAPLPHGIGAGGGYVVNINFELE
jgi:TonB family protein